ncbi:MAG TPA: anti-sigma regulatory factor [Rhodocyclaceae bacterium]|nr:anti-sigma regulatory factor [Rhodocyclaceae bacterium]
MPLHIGSELIHLAEPIDIVRARAGARRVAGLMGFGPADQTRLATAVSELSRNVLQYASKGQCEISDVSTETERGICIVVEDNGPGIPDISRAMQDGYSTSGGLGAGLPGTQRLMDSFAIDSQPGLTRVSITMRRKLA